MSDDRMFLARDAVREAVSCPRCGAKAGSNCLGARGKLRESNHQERVAAAEPTLAPERVAERLFAERMPEKFGSRSRLPSDPPPDLDDVELASELRRAAADPTTFASNKVQLLKQAKDLDRKARNARRLAAVHRFTNQPPKSEVIEAEAVEVPQHGLPRRQAR